MLIAGHMEAYREFTYSLDAECASCHGHRLRPDRFPHREGNYRGRSIFWREPHGVLHDNHKRPPINSDAFFEHKFGT